MVNLTQEIALEIEETSTTVIAEKRKFDAGYISISGCKSRKSILVVDDSETIRELLSVFLHKEGIVCSAINGLDALSKFAGNHFDAIVSDIEMPAMNGIELYKNVPPAYRDSFLFFSGTVNVEYIRYISMNNLMLFRKPDEILKLHRAVQVKLQQSPLVKE